MNQRKINIFSSPPHRFTQNPFYRTDALGDRGICIHYDVAEFQEDLKTLSEKG